jgi:carbonic anhydrase/acetyltransferase-like protein (isoleucine patch superfamily)
MLRLLLASLGLAPLLLCGCSNSSGNGTVAPAIVATSYVDPTASLTGNVQFGDLVFIAPFARAVAGGGHIRINDGSDLQDNTFIDADTGRDVTIGPWGIIAHGATVRGPAIVGNATGPCFVGFNSLVDGATIEGGAAVLHLARVGPGVVLHSGKKVLPGKNVTTQAEADNELLGKVTSVTAEDAMFLEDVLRVNQSFARSYAALRAASLSLVTGINVDPVDAFSTHSLLPHIGGLPVTDPSYRNRIIGNATFADPLNVLTTLMGNRDSIRTDEGSPFVVGQLGAMADEVTFHALIGSRIDVGTGCRFGLHALVHGGEDDARTPAEVTRLGDNVIVGDGAVVFRSLIGSGSTIGNRAFVDSCDLPPGTVVPAMTILIGNVNQGMVEW